MKKGFTLVELLAVIVILALIALITIPVILNVVEKSKVKTYQRSIDSYGRAVEKGIAEYMMDNENNTSKKLTYDDIKNYIKYEGNKVECKVNIYSDKSIYLENCKVNGEEITYTYGTYQKIKYAKLVQDNNNNGKPDIGDKYTYKVNDIDTFNFYVLSIEEDKVNLIMDKNICEDGTLATATNICTIAWYAGENHSSNGPVTAMQGIYNATKNWSNVPDIDFSGNKAYEDEGHLSGNGYGKIETTEAGIKITKKDGTTEVTRSENQTPVIPYEEGKPLKSRLPKLEEVYNTGTDTNHCHTSYRSCPAWLTNGLKIGSAYYPDNEHIEGITGYWTLSSNPLGYGARAVNCWGTGADSGNNNDDSSYGIRPVITVSLSDLQ